LIHEFASLSLFLVFLEFQRIAVIQLAFQFDLFLLSFLRYIRLGEWLFFTRCFIPFGLLSVGWTRLAARCTSFPLARLRRGGCCGLLGRYGRRILF
jgi:hypothetical protein